MTSPKGRLLILASIFFAPVAIAQTSTPLAQVDGHDVTVEELLDTVATLGDQATPALSNPKLRLQLVENLVSRKLLEKAARAAGTEKDTAYSRRLALLETDLLIQIYIEHQVSALLDDKGLKAYFTKNIDRFSHKEVRISRIYTSDAKKAARLHKLLRHSPKHFAAIAAKESEDLNASKLKGDLGFSRRGDLAKPIDDFAFAAQKDDISSVLTLDKGYAIAMLTDMRPGQTVAYENVRQDVERLARENLTRQLIETLRAKARVHINAEQIKNAKLSIRKP